MCEYKCARGIGEQRRNKPLVFHGTTSKVGADESGLGDHSLPALLCSLLSGLDDLEHLLFGNTSDLGQRHTELGGLLGSLVLDGRGKSLCIFLVAAVEQVGGQGSVGGLCGLAGLDVALLVGSDLLLHLDLLLAALLLVQLRAQTAVVLSLLGTGVALSGLSLALALIVIETLAMLLGKAFHILILRHGGG